MFELYSTGMKTQQLEEEDEELFICHIHSYTEYYRHCFSCSHTVLPKEHSLGVIFFLLTFLM